MPTPGQPDRSAVAQKSTERTQELESDPRCGPRICAWLGAPTHRIVAIFAIILMLGVAGFIAWRAGAFGGGNGSDHKSLDINVNTK